MDAFQPGVKVRVKGSPGIGEVLHNYGEGSVAVGWEGVGLRVMHWSQLEVVA